MRKLILVSLLLVVISVATVATAAITSEGNDSDMTQLVKNVNNEQYLPVSYFMQMIGYGDKKYYGQNDGKNWLIVNGVKVEFRVPSASDDINSKEFSQMTINGKTIDINKQIALEGDSSNPYILGAAMAKAVGYIQHGSGITMASIWYEQNSKPITVDDLKVRSLNGGDITIGESDFYQVFANYGAPMDMSGRFGNSDDKEHMYYSNGLFLDMTLNNNNQKWIVTHANIRSSQYWPPRSVKVGDSTNDMFKFFGNGYNQIGDKYFYTMLTNYWEQKGIVFTVEGKKIREIDIYNRTVAK